MKRIKNLFDLYDFCEALLEPPVLEGTRMIVRLVENLCILSEHPIAAGNQIYVDNCRLVFDRVSGSKRRLDRLLELKDGEPVFGPEEIIEDGPFPQTDGNSNAYEFCGFMKPDISYLDWDVTAGSVFVLLPSEAECYRVGPKIHDVKEYEDNKSALRDAGILPSKRRDDLLAGLRERLPLFPDAEDPLEM